MKERCFDQWMVHISPCSFLLFEPHRSFCNKMQCVTRSAISTTPPLEGWCVCLCVARVCVNKQKAEINQFCVNFRVFMKEWWNAIILIYDLRAIIEMGYIDVHHFIFCAWNKWISEQRKISIPYLRKRARWGEIRNDSRGGKKQVWRRNYFIYSI